MKKKSKNKKEKELKGIGGLLLVPIIMIIFLGICSFGQILVVIFTEKTNLAIPYLIVGILLFYFSITSLIYGFKYKKKFIISSILFMIFAYMLTFLFIVEDFLVIGKFDYIDLIGFTIGYFIWIAYILKSKRVKNTFVKR